jgi:hypothetical protein
MTILKDVLYDPDPDGQGSGTGTDGSTPPPSAEVLDAPAADSTESTDIVN